MAPKLLPYLQARARDLFYGLWTTDLFMQRVEANADWSLFCPNEAPGLADCWGDEHAALYVRYEQEGRAKRNVKAQQLWFAILEAQVGGWSHSNAHIVTCVLVVIGSSLTDVDACRLRQATRTCSSKTPAIESQISRIWAQ